MNMNEQPYKIVFEKLYRDEKIVPPSMKWKTVKFEEYKAIYEESVKDVFSFWQREARNLTWCSTWSKVYDGISPQATWFKGGKLSAYYNVIGKHRETWIWSKAALIWEGEEGVARAVTYGELDALVGKIAYSMKNNGLKPGEWIIIYSSPTIESIATMLAAVKLGVPFEPVFTGFGFWELARRIKHREPKLVFTSDGFYRRGRIIDVLNTLRKAVEQANYRGQVVVYSRIGAPSLRENEVLFDDFTSTNESTEEYVANSEHPLFGLHSGYRDDYEPVTHSTGGFLVQVYSTSRWVGIRPRDTYFCTVWPGWITGVGYLVFGPLMIGSTVLLYDGGPDYPSWDRWWSLIEDYAVTLFLTTGGALRLLSRKGDENVRRHNMDTLKAIIVTAEPLEADIWWWTYRVVGTGYTSFIESIPSQLSGRIPVVNMYIQSEVGTFISGNLVNYTFTPIAPGSSGTPIPGFHVMILSEKGEIENEGFGEIILLKPWPAMPIEYPPEYAEKWKDNYYRTGDHGYLSREGYLYVLGRTDGVLKTSGYRLSPGAIEKALRQALGLNTLVLPCLDELKFTSPLLLYSGGSGESEIRELVRKYVGSISEPSLIVNLDQSLLEEYRSKGANLILPSCSKEALRNN
jgi:acetyl-CoA synthetase